MHTTNRIHGLGWLTFGHALVEADQRLPKRVTRFLDFTVRQVTDGRLAAIAKLSDLALRPALC